MARRMNGKANCMSASRMMVWSQGPPRMPATRPSAGADGARHEHRGQADEDRRLRAVDHAAQDVAAELVGAQDRERAVGGAAGGPGEARQEVLLVRVGGREPAGRDRAQADHEEDHRAEPGAARAQEDRASAASRAAARAGRARPRRPGVRRPQAAR